MGITDSTTTLDTAWVETYKTHYTSGVLSTISDCVTEVESKLKRGTLSATSTPTLTQVEGWIKRAKLTLAKVRDFSFTSKYAYMTTSSGYYIYSLPPDFNGGDISIRDTTNNYQLRHWSIDWFDKRYPDPGEETNDEPAVFCLRGNELWLAPPPDGAYKLYLNYNISGAETTEYDMSWLPEYERFLCCDFAVGMAFESLHMWGESDRYLGRWDSEVRLSVRSDGRKKWKMGQFKAIDVFQEYTARNSQA